MKRAIPPPTKAEQERWDQFRHIGCIVTRLRRGIVERGYEIQHILSGGRDMGHWYTIPLTPYYHRGVITLRDMTKADMIATYGASLAHGSKEFVKSHGKTELELWVIVQRMLGLDEALPTSKIVPRAVA